MTAPTPLVLQPRLEGRRSVLAVTSQLPWPLNTGGHLRSFHLLQALAARFEVRLVAPVLPGEHAAVEALTAAGISIRPVPLPVRSPWRERFRALGSALRRDPYVMYSRHDHPAVRQTLVVEADWNPPDLVYLDHLDSLVYQKDLSRFPAVLDLHNVYSTLVERASAQQPRWWTRAYLRHEARLLRRRESHAAQHVESLFAVSEEERDYFAGLGARSVHRIPNGVDTSLYSPMPIGRPGARAILYLGALSWPPNAQAARILAQEVLPKVRARHPDACVWLVGRDPPPDLRALHNPPAIEVTGGVPSVLPYLERAAMLAVPLESGGGTRLKILEAFAAGLPVLSSPVGCEGLNVAHEHHLLIAQRADFTEGICRLFAQPGLGRSLAEQARALVRHTYDWSLVGKTACEAIEEVMHAHPVSGK